MFNDERHNKILEYIELEGRVEVSKLSEKFGVSLDTVRRDLKKLEEDGHLKRTHGGAVRIKPIGKSYDYATRKKLHPKEKEDIAKIAVSYIKEHDSILIDGSTTIGALIPLLSSYSNLTVFASNVQIALELLSTNKCLRVFIIGGVLDTENGSVVSHDAVTFINKLHVNKVFIGSCAISPERGLSADIDDAPVKKAMLEAGDEIFILADHTKFKRESIMQVGEISSNYTIITDSKIEQEQPQILESLIEIGCKVLITK